MNNTEFLWWLRDRLIHVYGESPSFDYVQRLEDVARGIERREEQPEMIEAMGKLFDEIRQTAEGCLRDIQTASAKISERDPRLAQLEEAVCAGRGYRHLTGADERFEFVLVFPNEDSEAARTVMETRRRGRGDG